MSCIVPYLRSRPDDMAENVAGYRRKGYRRFQLKVGGDPNLDIERIRAVSAVLETERQTYRRRQYRLAETRSDACCASRCRYRCIY